MKIFDVAVLAAKYAYNKLEIWACETIYGFVKDKLDIIPVSVRISGFPSILKFAYSIGDAVHALQLRRSLVSYFSEAMRTSTPVAVAVMDLTEDVDIPELFGLSRFMLLKVKPEEWSAMQFTVERKVCLLQGYYSLVQYWQEILEHDAVFVHQVTCAGIYCKQNFSQTWRREVLGDEMRSIPIYDIPARLNKMSIRLEVRIPKERRAHSLL
jgi:hypothetical protein